MKKVILLLTLVCYCLILDASPRTAATPVSASNARAIHSKFSFIENKGQINDQNLQPRADIQFKLAGGNGLNIFVGNGALHYQFSRANSPIQPEDIKGDKTHDPSRDRSYNMYRMDVELVGANQNPVVQTDEQQDYFENYYTPGTGPDGGTALAFNKITYRNIYPNIDWVLYTSNGRLKHEFIVKPGGDVANIQIKYGGARQLFINEAGNLIAETPQGTITEDAPVCYQSDGKIVSSTFKLKGSILSYETANYTGTLTVDPGLGWGTYFGDSGDDWALGVITDASGNIYWDGATSSASAIATSGAYQTTLLGSEDFLLAKFNNSGVPVWATYYGGAGDEEAYSITLDPSGNLYVPGWTNSTSGFATSGTYQPSYGGGLWDGFLAKFSNSGSRIWATYYGGSVDEEAWSVALSPGGDIYMTGNTKSSSGIATSGAHLTSFAGYYDAFLAKFTPSGALIWGTYYGGSGDEYGSVVATDIAGNIYIDGYTQSTSGIATSGAFMTTYGGGSAYDAFLAKFNPAGVLVWGTYYGGYYHDRAYGLGVDSTCAVYMGGFTASTSGISTAGSYQPTFGGGTNDGFLVKFDSSGARIWGTYYGGNDYDPGAGVFVDDSANVFLTGRSHSTSGIATTAAYQVTNGGGASDAYFVKFDSSGARKWATFYGGPGNEFGNVITADKSGNIYLAGLTNGTSGISTTGCWQPAYGGGASDAMLIQFKNCNLPDPGVIIGPTSLCAGATITLAPSITGGVWTLTNTNAVLISPGVITGITPGHDTIIYTVTNSCGTTYVLFPISINPLPVVSLISGPSSLFIGGSITLSDTTAGGTWSSSAPGIATVSSSGVVTGVTVGVVTITYSVTNSFGCTGFATKNDTVKSKVAITDPLTESSLAIYPNPTTGKFLLTFSGQQEGVADIAILDILGNVVFSEQTNLTVNGQVAIDLSDLRHGIYVLHLRSAQAVHCEKIILEK